MLRIVLRPALSKVEYLAIRSLCDLPNTNNDSKKKSYNESKIYSTKTPYLFVGSPLLPQGEEPLKRALNALSGDFKRIWDTFQGKAPAPMSTQTDVLIVGGGIVGTSIAYWIKERVHKGISVTVVEKEPANSSTSLAIATNGVYQHIPSKPIANMAKFSADFYRQLSRAVEDPVLPSIDLEFTPCNSLQLASEEGMSALMDLVEMYTDMDWKNELMRPEMLKKRFPWMNVDGIALASLGLNREGVFNQWKALTAMRRFAVKHEAEFITGNIVGFQYENFGDAMTTNHTGTDQYFSPNAVAVLNPDGSIEFHHFSIVILAAGARIGELFHMFNIAGSDFQLPVEARKRYVHCVNCPNGPGISMPLVLEPSGLRFKRSGIMDDYLVWKDPDEDNEPPVDNLDVDESYFHKHIQPHLVNRAPVFKDAQVKSSWAGIIDQSTWDGNMIFGPHPGFHNVFIAGGFGHDEFLYAPAVGQAMMQIIVDGAPTSSDFHIFDYSRVLNGLKLQTEMVA